MSQVKNLKDRGRTGRTASSKRNKLLWLIISLIAFILILINPLAGFLIALSTVLYASIRHLRHRERVEDALLLMKPLNSPKRIKGLWKVELMRGVESYLPWKDAPCLLLLKGFQLTVLGMLSIRPTLKTEVKLEGLLSSLYASGYGLTYVVSCAPGGSGDGLWDVRVLLLLKARRLVLWVNASIVKDAVDDMIKRIEWARAVLASYLGPANVRPLSGDDLIEAARSLL